VFCCISSTDGRRRRYGLPHGARGTVRPTATDLREAGDVALNKADAMTAEAVKNRSRCSACGEETPLVGFGGKRGGSAEVLAGRS